MLHGYVPMDKRPPVIHKKKEARINKSMGDGVETQSLAQGTQCGELLSKRQTVHLYMYISWKSGSFLWKNCEYALTTLGKCLQTLKQYAK